MKKLYTFLCLLLFMFSIPTQAQLKVGITGGLNISKLSVGDDSYKGYVDKIRPGFFVGPTLIYSLPAIGLGCDISALYDMRGARSKETDKYNSIYCHSFQFPFNIRYGIEIGDMIYGFVFTGPQFGVNAGSKEQLIIAGKGKSTGHALERRWVSNATNFSWNIGVGGIVLDKIQVRISYNLALKNTGEIQQVDLVDGTSKVLTTGKASACQVAISYLF